MRFPDSGAYVVPGALAPVDINRASCCPGAPSRSDSRSWTLMVG
jgi:hypothetical protein